MNKTMLMGRLTADPELKTTPNGVSTTSFTLAVQRDFAKQGEERQTDFIDCVAWRNTAEFICKYFRKGSMIALCGQLRTRTYTNKDGNHRKAYEVIVENAYFTGEKSGGTAHETVVSTPSVDAAVDGSPDDGDLPF